MKDALPDHATLVSPNVMGAVPVEALVQRALRRALGFDPSLADAGRIRRLFETSRLGDEEVVVSPFAGTDSASRDIDVEIALSLDRARGAIQRTLDGLRSVDGSDAHERQLLVTLHGVEVADQFRTLQLPGRFRKQTNEVASRLESLVDEIEHDHPESAFNLVIAKSALDSVSGAFGSLIHSRDDNCAAKVGDVIGKLDCVRLAVDSIHLELDLLGRAPDGSCSSVMWADDSVVAVDSAADGSPRLTFDRFVQLAESSTPRLTRLLDTVGGDGLSEVSLELEDLQRILRDSDGEVRLVTAPGGDKVEGLQAALAYLDLTFTDAIHETEVAQSVCTPAAAKAQAARRRGAARRSSVAQGS